MTDLADNPSTHPHLRGPLRAELAAAAAKATPGHRWYETLRSGGKGGGADTGKPSGFWWIGAELPADGEPHLYEQRNPADAEFAARATPDAVLALIEEGNDLRATIETLRATLEDVHARVTEVARLVIE